MKTLKTYLAVILAAFALLASLATATSAVGIASVVPTGTDTGSFSTDPPSPVLEGQLVKLSADWPVDRANKTATFYKETSPGSGDYASVGTDDTNSYGNAYIYDYEVTASQKVYAAITSTTDETEVHQITANPPPPSGALLDTPDPNSSDQNVRLGKKWTAHFTGAAKVPGQSTSLKLREICTYETDETNPETGPFDSAVKQKDCKGPWKTVATSTQNSNGDTTFNISDKYEVEHVYRASSGTANSNEVKFVPPFTEDDPYGISTGLSEVHFNTYEQASVNTRDHYFEGAFSMTSSTKNASPTGTSCAQAADKDGKTVIMKSVLKGRGNYSWSFPKKSFTLKTGDKLNLCGLGKSKKYALVANDYDKSLMRNSLAGYVGSIFNKTGWTPKSTPVDFYMNGSYRGSYLLIERIAIQGPKTGETDSRLDLDELTSAETSLPEIDGGYVLEWDFRKGADYNAYLGSDSGYVGVKEPENDYGRTGSSTGTGVNTHEGINQEQKDYIKAYLNKVDDSLRAGPSWQTYIDKESAVDYYIAMEYMKPVDGNMWASVYMYKPRGEKLHFGPLWDFDLAAGSATRAGNVASSSSFYLRNNLGVSAQQDTTNGKTWFNRLNEYPSFRQAVADRWDEIKGELNVTGYLSGQKSILQQSQAANFQKWGRTSRISDYQVIKGSWDGDTGYLSSWAANRKSWLDGGSGF